MKIKPIRLQLILAWSTLMLYALFIIASGVGLLHIRSIVLLVITVTSQILIYLFISRAIKIADKMGPKA